MTRTQNNTRVADAFSDTRKEPKDYFFFLGDLSQIFQAVNVAGQLGIEIGIIGEDTPYVGSLEEFERIKQFIVENKIDGYWNYI